MLCPPRGHWRKDSDLEDKGFDAALSSPRDPANTDVMPEKPESKDLKPGSLVTIPLEQSYTPNPTQTPGFEFRVPTLPATGNKRPGRQQLGE